MIARKNAWIAFGVAVGLAAGVGVALIAIRVPPPPAPADPNVETSLPADGVLSISRSGDDFTIVTSGDAFEIKYMTSGSTRAQPEVCGVNAKNNYGLPLCTTTFVVTITHAPVCTYWQIDGIPGENHSDPYVCRPPFPPTSSPTVTPTVTPAPTETPTWTPTPETTPTTPVVTPEPTSTPTPESPTPSVTPEPSPSVTPPLIPPHETTPPTDPSWPSCDDEGADCKPAPPVTPSPRPTDDLDSPIIPVLTCPGKCSEK